MLEQKDGSQWIHFLVTQRPWLYWLTRGYKPTPHCAKLKCNQEKAPSASYCWTTDTRPATFTDILHISSSNYSLQSSTFNKWKWHGMLTLYQRHQRCRFLRGLLRISVSGCRGRSLLHYYYFFNTFSGDTHLILVTDIMCWRYSSNSAILVLTTTLFSHSKSAHIFLKTQSDSQLYHARIRAPYSQT